LYYALLVLVGIMAIVVWWLARQTVNVTPWAEQHGAGTARGDDGSLPLINIKVGLGVFLAVATSLFALLISAYHMRMLGDDWSRVPIPRVLWLNTGVLVLASLAMHWTQNAARTGSRDGVIHGLAAAGALSFGFLAGQLWAWQQLAAAGYYAAANPSYAFFYLLTAVHGLHLLGGLFVWARTTYRTYRSADPERVRLSVELCTVYWDYLFAVWVVLFAVLLHTHD
jgi:cytochrome c oxidase subunit 3